MLISCDIKYFRLLIKMGFHGRLHRAAIHKICRDMHDFMGLGA